MTFDLTGLPHRFLAQYGREKVAEVVGRPLLVVDLWTRTGNWPLEAVQKLLEFDPSPFNDVRPLVEPAIVGAKLAVILPTNRKPEPATMESIVRMYDSKSMQFIRESFNSLFHVRNMCAARFLASPCEWSWWSDDDNVHPCGDAAWYKRITGLTDMPNIFAGLHSINRLLSTGKKLVGVSYVSKRDGAVGQFAGAQGIEISEQLRQGPRNEIMKRDWVGFGGVLVHRSVFEDIIKTQAAEVAVKNEQIKSYLGYEYSFFRPLEDDMGDDISFCARARKAGHEVFVDLALASAHVGTKPYTYRDLRRK